MLTCVIFFVHHDMQRYHSLLALPPCFCAFKTEEMLFEQFHYFFFSRMSFFLNNTHQSEISVFLL